jgi:ABC-type lipoprotein release transport system permease subunit
MPGCQRGEAVLRAALAQARRGLRARRRRVALGAVGIVLASAMLSAAVVVSYSLGTGFDRAARAAGMPEIIARFHVQPAAAVARRIRSLPDIARYSLRYEVDNVGLAFGRHHTGGGVAEVLDAPGAHRGYALVAGHQLPARGADVLVERALAQAWGIRLGDTVQLVGLGPERVVGFAEGPDDVGYPLGAPRVYVSRPALIARYGPEPNPRVNLAEVWLRNPRYLGEVLAQAREVSFGLTDLQFATRAGVQVLISQAAGIVIDLLVALSVIALLTAGVLLAASARAEVQRRLRAFGVRRAVGETRALVALAQGLEGLLVAVPAASAGVIAGALSVLGPSGRLLTLLNEPGPGWALLGPVLGAWGAGALLPALGAAWPAWRATREPAVGLLRGGDIAATSGRGRSARRFAVPTGLVTLGARLLAARRARLAATALTLGLSAAFVLLMLALAAELSSLETDPSALGKRYQLTASLPASAAPAVRRIPGVLAVAPRYQLYAADSFSLGESIDVIAYPHDHQRFEAPPLVAGRRLRGEGQAEVGSGLADALGLSPGTELALALPGATRELRLRVSGVVSSLQDEGRVAYVPAGALLALDHDVPEQLSVVVAPSADQNAVEAAIARLGGAPASTGGVTTSGGPLVAVLRTILIAVAVVDGLVCLYALVQACSLTVLERRRTLAVLRSFGAGSGALARVLAGAIATLVLPAAVLGILLERLVLGPVLSRLAASYAVLPLGASAAQLAVVLAGLAAAGALAVWWVTAGVTRAPVVEGLAG